MNYPVCGRLAPSPTGALHLGNARSFLLAWLSIRSKGGQIVLRIEDLDHPKVKPAYISQIYDDLAWLGLDWDEGPGRNGTSISYVQSERIEEYARALNRLEGMDRVYPCICSRKDVEEAQSAPHLPTESLFYPGTCRNLFASFEDAAARLPNGRIPAWRFKLQDRTYAFKDLFCGAQEENLSQYTGDFTIARHSQGAGYMLAVVVDDFLMNITEILRGDDLLKTTHCQIALQEALGYPTPNYIHVPLVVAQDGRRLAKRHGDTRISQLREKGVSSQKVVGLLAYWSGMAAWNEQVCPEDLIDRFRLDRIPDDPVILTQKVKDFLGID